MRTNVEPASWVVYRMQVRGRSEGMNAVCEQREWDAMELGQPGHHTLIRAGIANEGEAERLARVGTEGEVTKQRAKRPKQAPAPVSVALQSTLNREITTANGNRSGIVAAPSP